MRHWIGAFKWQIACEAAILNDEDAPLFLRSQLDQCEGGEKGYEVLLTALAWFDPEGALSYYDTAAMNPGGISFIPRIWLEAYSESQLLLGFSEEQQTAYAAMAALFPKNTPEANKGERVLGLACARRSLEEFLSRPDWDNYIDYFLFAKLWLAFPEALLKRVHAEGGLLVFWRHHYSAIGQVLLGKRREPQDIPHLVALVEEFCQKRYMRSDGVSGVGTFYREALCEAVQVLAERAPVELCRLLPDLLVITCRGDGPQIVNLAAHLFTQMVCLRCHSTMALLPLKNRIEELRTITHARRWVRVIRQRIPELTSEPETALRLIRVFRLFVIVRRIKQVPPEQAQRARRWHTRGQRFLDSVEFPFWKALLQEDLDCLQRDFA